jgi:hypothetical protein
MGDQPAKRGRGRPRTGMAQDGAARQAAYERRKRDRATTLAIALVLLARKDDAIRRSLDRATLEAMRDSLTPTGKAGRDVENWIASLTENQPSPPSGSCQADRFVHRAIQHCITR